MTTLIAFVMFHSAYATAIFSRDYASMEICEQAKVKIKADLSKADSTAIISITCTPTGFHTL